MFDIAPLAGNVHEVRFKVPDSDWEQWVHLSADHHFDSTQCDRQLLKEHYELAKQRNALSFVFGDIFDVMQGKYDPRKNYDELRPEYKGANYLDLVVDDAAKFYGQYADHIGVITLGNHESTLERRMGTNLIDRLVERLRMQGANAWSGGYTGYIIFRFLVHQTKRSSIILKYHHGMGGGNAPVTRGVIQSNRMAVMFPDADIVVSGHNHESWSVPIQQEKLSQRGRITKRPQWHIRVPSYKDGWGSKVDKGFDVEKGTPKPRGCVWLRFYPGNTMRNEIRFEFTQMVR